jgi:ketosteroid isomerase-like protein
VLAQVGAPDYQPESIVNDVLRVRVFGDVATATARGTAMGRYRGQRADMAFLYTRICVKRDGHWQAVAAHASQAPSATGDSR